MAAKNSSRKEEVWRWCPVCMSNQVFEWQGGKLKCTNAWHHHLLRKRKDLWVRDLPEWQALHQGS
jgi:hypothetical protein